MLFITLPRKLIVLYVDGCLSSLTVSQIAKYTSQFTAVGTHRRRLKYSLHFNSNDDEKSNDGKEKYKLQLGHYDKAPDKREG